MDYRTGLLVNYLIDIGKKEDVDVIIEHIKKQDIIEYLGEKYKEEVWKNKFPDSDGGGEYSEVNEKLLEFVNTHDKRDIATHYWVVHNGLNLIIAGLYLY